MMYICTHNFLIITKNLYVSILYVQDPFSYNNSRRPYISPI